MLFLNELCSSLCLQFWESNPSYMFYSSQNIFLWKRHEVKKNVKSTFFLLKYTLKYSWKSSLFRCSSIKTDRSVRDKKEFGVINSVNSLLELQAINGPVWAWVPKWWPYFGLVYLVAKSCFFTHLNWFLNHEIQHTFPHHSLKFQETCNLKFRITSQLPWDYTLISKVTTSYDEHHLVCLYRAARLLLLLHDSKF